MKIDSECIKLEIGDKFGYEDGDVYDLKLVAIGEQQVVGKDTEDLLWIVPYDEVVLNNSTPIIISNPTI